MGFVADDLGAWLVGLLADAALRRLTAFVFGSEQERALRQAATAAVRRTAAELRPEGGERTDELAMVINEVFSDPSPNELLPGQANLLEALQTGIAKQLALLDNVNLTGMGESSADLLGIPADTLAHRLTTCLIQELVVRGAQGGPLQPLIAQLNHDVTHIQGNEIHRQGQRLEGLLCHLSWQLKEAITQTGNARMATEDNEDEEGENEFRGDLIALLNRLEAWARAGRLPGYLSAGSDMASLSRPVRVRPDVRSGQASEMIAGQNPGAGRKLPAERSPGGGPLVPWAGVAAEHQRLIVLADPGLGKSWLIRSETYCRCVDALALLNSDGELDGVIIPVPLRCDQLSEAPGRDLAEKAAGYLVAQGLLDNRSHEKLAHKIYNGEAVLLLDALDELTTAQEGPVRRLLREWADRTGDKARCVITSRIAGYTGPPIPNGHEVELQPFTSDDVMGVIKAWALPATAAGRLRVQMRDPAIAAMARVPLLLALMCSLAASSSAEDLPRTRGQLLDRVMRWFLTRSHRSADDLAAPTLDDLRIAALLELLSPLAFALASQPDGWIDLIPQDRLLKEIRTAGPAFTELRLPAAEVLRELSVRAGILVPAGNPSAGRSPGYLFLHRAAAEYLVARHLAALPEAQWLPIVEQHRWFDPDWAEVIPMLGEYLVPAAASKLIVHLAAAKADPFNCSLYTATRIWAARPDADRLLPSRTADELAKRFVALVRSRARNGAHSLNLSALVRLPKPLLQRLIALTADSHWMVRLVAARALAARDEPGVTEALVGVCRDPVAKVRREIAYGLSVREGPGVTETLVAMCSDSDAVIREQAAKGLALRQEPCVTETLLGLRSDPVFSVQQEALKALAARETPDPWMAPAGGFGIHRAGDHWPYLIGSLLEKAQDPDKIVRLRIVRTLATLEGPAATKALQSLCGDLDRDVRRTVAQVLANRDSPDVSAALLGLLKDTDAGVRRQAVRSIASREGADATDALVRLLEHPDPAMRGEAAWSLEYRERPDVKAVLLGLLKDTNAGVQRQAVRSIAGQEGVDATEALVRLLEHPDPGMREVAAQSLAQRKGPGVTEALLALSSHPHWAMREAAARGLAGRGEPGVTAVLHSLCTDPDEEVRREAAEVLADREAPGVTQALLSLARHPDVGVRRQVARGLTVRNGRDVIPTLLSMQRDAAVAVRWQAVRAVARSEEPGVTEALLARLNDTSIGVQRQAVRSLAGREEPGVIKALLDLLNHPDRDQRWEAAGALSGPKATQALATWISCVTRKDQIDLPLIMSLAEQLVIRNYRYIDRSKQEPLRAAMARLSQFL